MGANGHCASDSKGRGGRGGISHFVSEGDLELMNVSPILLALINAMCVSMVTHRGKTRAVNVY